MARIRSIKPEVCTSFSMAILSDGAERTFTRLWTHADDEGRGIDHPKLIKAAIYPLNDEKTERKVAALLDELAAAGFLWRYEVDGRRYFQVVNFGEHQKPRHPTPSKFPPPPPDFDPTTTNGGRATADRRKPPEDRAVPPHVDVVVDGDGGGEGAPPQRQRPTPIPSDFALDDDMHAWAVEHGVGGCVDFETAKFIDHHKAKGSKVADWRAAWQNWMRRVDGFLQAPRRLSVVPRCENADCRDGWDYGTDAACVKCAGKGAA